MPKTKTARPKRRARDANRVRPTMGMVQDLEQENANLRALLDGSRDEYKKRGVDLGEWEARALAAEKILLERGYTYQYGLGWVAPTPRAGTVRAHDPNDVTSVGR